MPEKPCVQAFAAFYTVSFNINTETISKGPDFYVLLYVNGVNIDNNIDFSKKPSIKTTPARAGAVKSDTITVDY